MRIKKIISGTLAVVMTAGIMFSNPIDTKAEEEKLSLEQKQQIIRDTWSKMYSEGIPDKIYIGDLKIKWADYYKAAEETQHKFWTESNMMGCNAINQSSRDSSNTYMEYIWIYDVTEESRWRRKKCEEVMEYCHEQVSGMTDLDKLIWFNNYLVDNCIYHNTDDIDNICHSGSSAIAYGYCVCSGYAEAFKFFLDMENIENDFVYNSNHQWNYVKLDGKVYQLDATWNDTRKSGSRSRYTYLLRNDTEFKGTSEVASHDTFYTWNAETKARDYSTISEATDYTEWYVHKVLSKMHYYDGLWYYTKDGNIYKNDAKGTCEEKVIEGTKLSIIGIDNDVLVYKEGSAIKTYILKSTSDNSKVSACEHSNKETKKAVEKNCRTTGYTGDSYCKDCGIICSVGSQIDISEHTLDSGVVVLEPTGSAKGHTLYTCEKCGFTKEKWDIDKLPSDAECLHSKTEVQNKNNPDCTSDGYSGDTACASCHKVLSKGTTVKPLGHIFLQISETEEAINYECAICGDTKVETKVLPPAPKQPNKITTSFVQKTIANNRNIKLNVSDKSGTLSFSSSDKKVKVTADGVVKVPKNYAGKFTITVTGGNDNYITVKKKILITVKPSAPSVISIVNKTNKSTKVIWKKISYANGYQVIYSTSAAFKKGNRIINIKSSTNTSKIIKGLKKGKTYYVRVRCYKNVDGKRVYSSWSAKKKMVRGGRAKK